MLFAVADSQIGESQCPAIRIEHSTGLRDNVADFQKFLVSFLWASVAMPIWSSRQLIEDVFILLFLINAEALFLTCFRVNYQRAKR